MHDYWPRLIALFAENLRRFERGEQLLNLVDKAAGFRLRLLAVVATFRSGIHPCSRFARRQGPVGAVPALG